jgi:transketolase
MDEKKKTELCDRARDIRRLIIRAIGAAGSGHLGGSLSIAELLAVLYFEQMNIDPKNPQKERRDRLILSKGHAGPALYSALALAGYFDVECLLTLNKPLTNLPSHCDMTKTTGVDMTAGSLGQGISCAVGVAKAAKLTGGNETIFAVVGDGESQEGTVWEASMAASHFNLDNLIVFLDYNHMQVDGFMEDIMNLTDPAAKWSAFGFKTFNVSGHDVSEISDAIDRAKDKKDGRPTLIILNTLKGKGVSFVESEGVPNHSMALTAEQVSQALDELGGEI